MIKFDLERALAGDKVFLGDHEASQFKVYDVEHGVLPLVFVVNGRFHYRRLDGTTPGDTPLTMAPKMPKMLSGFIVVYDDVSTGRIWSSYENAEQSVGNTGKSAIIDLSQFPVGHGL